MTEKTAWHADLVAVITHLVCSAPTSISETPTLAGFRLVDAANRIAAILLEHGDLEPADRAYLQATADGFRDHFNLAMTDQDAFARWLDDHARLATRAAMERAGLAD